MANPATARVAVAGHVMASMEEEPTVKPSVVVLLAASLAASGLVTIARAGEPLSPLPRPERTQSSNAASARPMTVLPASHEHAVTPQAVSSSATELSRDTSPAPLPMADAKSTGSGALDRGHVARAIFTHAIENREPVDPVSNLVRESGQIYFFTELRDMTGQIARHRWEYNDQIVAEKAFEVKGPRWRVWSWGPVKPDRPGTWKVTVLNDANQVIAEQELRVPVATGQDSPY